MNRACNLTPQLAQLEAQVAGEAAARERHVADLQSERARLLAENQELR